MREGGPCVRTDARIAQHCTPAAARAPRRLVAETIRPLDGGRKCFQLINGVLVERIVSEVLPIVDQNRDSVRSAVGCRRAGCAALLPRARRAGARRC